MTLVLLVVMRLAVQGGLFLFPRGVSWIYWRYHIFTGNMEPVGALTGSYGHLTMDLGVLYELMLSASSEMEYHHELALSSANVST